MHIEISGEDTKIPSDRGKVHLYTLGTLTLVCYMDEESDEELPEDAIFQGEYDDESSDDDLQIVTPTQTNEEISMNMACYHLQELDISYAVPDAKPCNRLDVELMLFDRDINIYKEFKQMFLDHVEDRLLRVCNSKRGSDMENDLSQLFYETICLNVVISGKSVWYYEDNIWQKSESTHYLANLLSKRFIPYLESTEIFEKAAMYLNSIVIRGRIITDVKNKLYYSGFESKIDSNKKIIGVSNGTLNIDLGTISESKVSDVISKSTHIDYIPYSLESREVHMLMKILKKIFPNPDLLKFFIRSCSTFLEGENSKKVFYVWWGSGNNCKTGMATLIQSTFGDYAGTAPVSLITAKREGSAGATPELCHIEGKLVVFLQEPNPKEKMKTGRIKELTGNDKIFVRNLFQSGREMEVKCKIVHVCNFPTASPDSDIAFKRRMVVIKFPSTFLDEEEYRLQKERGTMSKNTFKIKDGVEEVLRSMGSIFLSLLVREFKIFKEVGLQIPQIVRQNTEEFLTYGNHALKFIRKQLRHAKGEENSIEVHRVYDIFKIWFRDMYPSYSVPNNETFIKELNDEGFMEDENGIIHDIAALDTENTISI